MPKTVERNKDSFLSLRWDLVCSESPLDTCDQVYTLVLVLTHTPEMSSLTKQTPTLIFHATKIVLCSGLQPPIQCIAGVVGSWRFREEHYCQQSKDREKTLYVDRMYGYHHARVVETLSLRLIITKLTTKLRASLKSTGT